MNIQDRTHGMTGPEIQEYVEFNYLYGKDILIWN